jgi:hypothetical protein
MTKHISIRGGDIVLVEDANYRHLTQHEWFLSKTGYAVGLMPNGDGKLSLQYLRRIILEPTPSEQGNPVNGDPLDNRRATLRLVTSHQNHQNGKAKSNSHMGLKGVGWHKERGKYYPRIQPQGLRCHLGYFGSAETVPLTTPRQADSAICGPSGGSELRRRGFKLDSPEQF